VQTDTGRKPGTVMVHFQHASTARGAVMSAVGLRMGTFSAVSRIAGGRYSDGLSKRVL